MSNFKQFCEEILNEKKSWKLTIDGKPAGEIKDTGIKKKYAFDGFKGAERDVQTYVHYTTIDGESHEYPIDIFDNGKKKTLSYGSQTMGEQPNSMSDVDVILKYFKTNYGKERKIKIK